MSHILTDFKEFLEDSPTSWHAAKQVGNRLAMKDFIPLDEKEKWHLEPGKKYFMIRGGSLCAFVLPHQPPQQALILSSHTDSPCLKIKPLPAYQQENIMQLGVEVYGAPLLSSWLNRDLILAGRVVITDGKGEPEEHLVSLDDAVLFIPQLAIHLDREVNEKGTVLNRQDHLPPILSLSQETHALEKLLRRHLSFHTLLSFELCLVPCEKARFVGLKNEMLASYRLDNLTGVHAVLSAFGKLETPSQETLHIATFFDHEEIGSKTREGASSPFLTDLLKRVQLGLKIPSEEMLLLKNRSLCISIDMAHAFNPNYPKKHDPHHIPVLGKGIVVKHNANQQYASNALSSAVIVHACQSLNLPFQIYVNRSDIPSGSTIGPLIAQTTGINTVDIGCPQLSMHSIREIIACQDYLDMTRLLHYLMQDK